MLFHRVLSLIGWKVTFEQNFIDLCRKSSEMFILRKDYLNLALFIRKNCPEFNMKRLSLPEWSK
jgi:hypothetical protein